MDKDPGLKATVQGNLSKWMTSVQPEALARTCWLLGACPPQVLTLLAPMWKIGAVVEGHQLVDGASGSWGGTELCCILLDGAVDVTTHRPDGSDKVERITEGGSVISPLALISEVFDLEAEPIKPYVPPLTMLANNSHSLPHACLPMCVTC